MSDASRYGDPRSPDVGASRPRARDDDRRRRRTVTLVAVLVVLKIVCCVVLWYQLSSAGDAVHQIAVDKRAVETLEQTEALIERLERRLEKAGS